MADIKNELSENVFAKQRGVFFKINVLLGIIKK